MSIGTTIAAFIGKPYAKTDSPVYLKECDAAGSPTTTGDGTVWTNLGVMKDLKFDVEPNTISDQGESGADVINVETVKSYSATMTLMSRDKATRMIGINAKDKYYLMVCEGATLGTQTEVDVFAVCKVGAKWSRAYKDGYLNGLTIKTVSNSATLSVTLPTPIGTGTVSIPALQMFASDTI